MLLKSNIYVGLVFNFLNICMARSHAQCYSSVLTDKDYNPFVRIFYV